MGELNVMIPAALAVARWLLLAAELALALPVIYLVALAAGALVGAGRARVASRAAPAPAGARFARFAVIVPAHDEELLIGATLESLARLDYPADRFDVHVVADNCADRTAELARAAGALVHERTDERQRGKGHALAWIFDRLAAGDTPYDAYVVLDADTVVAPSLLRALDAGLARGALALQSHNAVLNAEASATAALRWVALSLMNYVRPLGRNTLGGSSTLTGNGMCLTPALLARHPWQAFGLSEDYQYYLTLVAAGERVRFAPDALVRSVMPTTPRQLQTQDIRWETINPDARAWQRQVARRLFVEGLRRRDWLRLDALAELLTPPLSTLVGGSALALAAAVALRAPLLALLAALLLALLLAYVGSAFALLRPPATVYLALAHAPAYIMRKLWVYFVLRRQRKHTRAWVRTARAAPVSGVRLPNGEETSS